jgi:microcin C transport system substrate-binding protein
MVNRQGIRPGFSHFDYTNPQAPKGGTMRRSAVEIGHFDHILPYIDKGIGVTQIDGMLYSPLAQRSMDEPYTVYGLVARQMERSPTACPCAFSSTPRRASLTANRSPPKTYATPMTC